MSQARSLTAPYSRHTCVLGNALKPTCTLSSFVLSLHGVLCRLLASALFWRCPPENSPRGEFATLQLAMAMVHPEMPHPAGCLLLSVLFAVVCGVVVLFVGFVLYY